jgi:hypothetical protein
MSWRACEFCRQSYHLSDGHCDCDHENKREEHERMQAADYEYQGEGLWEKEISRNLRTCRKTHKDGRVKKGDIYNDVVVREIWFDDEGNCDRSKITKYKMVIHSVLLRKYTHSYPERS